MAEVGISIIAVFFAGLELILAFSRKTGVSVQNDRLDNSWMAARISSIILLLIFAFFSPWLIADIFLAFGFLAVRMIDAMGLLTASNSAKASLWARGGLIFLCLLFFYGLALQHHVPITLNPVHYFVLACASIFIMLCLLFNRRDNIILWAMKTGWIASVLAYFPVLYWSASHAHPMILPLTMIGLNSLYSALSMQWITQNSFHEERALLDDLILRDHLTGLFNRRGFTVLAMREFSRARRMGRPACLAMLDLDGFKSVNDRHGHFMGDRLLLAVSTTISECLRHQDIFARFGGDEFCLMLPETDLEGANIIANRIRLAVEAVSKNFDGPSISVTVSIGVTATSGLQSLEEVMSEADRSLYAAKDQGKNCVVLNRAGPAYGRAATQALH